MQMDLSGYRQSWISKLCSRDIFSPSFSLQCCKDPHRDIDYLAQSVNSSTGLQYDRHRQNSHPTRSITSVLWPSRSTTPASTVTLQYKNFDNYNDLNAMDAKAFSDEAFAARKRESTNGRRLVRMESTVNGPAELEEKYVHNVYGSIAEHIGKHRAVPWPKVRHFLATLPNASTVLDVGSGGGKYSRVNRKITVLNCDVVRSMLKEGGATHAIVGDNLALPIRSCSLDAVISIAVIHHMATHERRRYAIEECIRVLKPGGRLLLCVWAYEQATRQFSAQDVLVPLYLRNEPTPLPTPTNEDPNSQETVAKLSTGHVETNPTRMIRIKRTTTAEQRVIDNSVGITNTMPSQPIGRLASLSNSMTSAFDAIWEMSPSIRRSTIINTAPPPIPNTTLPTSPRHSLQLDKSQLSLIQRHRPSLLTADGILSSMSRNISPSIARKIANAIGVNISDQEWLDEFSNDIFSNSYQDAIKQMYPNINFDEQEDELPTASIKEILEDELTFYRFYHVFKQGELDNLINSINGITIINTYYDHANWCVEVEKNMPLRI